MSPLEAAVDAAAAAGELLQAYAGQPLEIREKERRADLVTVADRAAERCIVDRLRAAYPDAAILGEEGGVQPGSSSRDRWIVDPLDGTTNFAHGYPLFCVSIAFEREREVLAGVVYAPAMNEWFLAERGAGATRNGSKLNVSGIRSVGEALVCTGFHPAEMGINAPYFARASSHAQGVRRDGSAALDLAYVAAGRFDAFWEFGLHAWDVAAGALIVREAGGRVTQVDGSPHTVESPSILATNAHVHEGMCELFADLQR